MRNSDRPGSAAAPAGIADAEADDQGITLIPSIEVNGHGDHSNGAQGMRTADLFLTLNQASSLPLISFRGSGVIYSPVLYQVSSYLSAVKLRRACPGKISRHFSIRFYRWMNVALSIIIALIIITIISEHFSTDYNSYLFL